MYNHVRLIVNNCPRNLIVYSYLNSVNASKIAREGGKEIVIGSANIRMRCEQINTLLNMIKLQFVAVWSAAIEEKEQTN